MMSNVLFVHFYMLKALIVTLSFTLRTVNNSEMDTGSSAGMEASAPPSIGSSTVMDVGLELPSNSTEGGSSTDLSQMSQSQYTEDKELFETKKDQQFA